jgi:hypothetical protein
VIRVEKLISLTSASGCGVTSPWNRASKANGTDGSDVGEGVGEVTCVAVSIKLVGIISGVFTGDGACVNSGEAGGIWVFNNGIDGSLGFVTRVKAVNIIPAATKRPRIK